MQDVSGNWIDPEHEDGNRDSVGVKVLRVIGQFICGCRGHDAMLQFGPDCLYLECSHCGWRSDGISVEARR